MTAKNTPGPWIHDRTTGRIGTADGTVTCMQSSAGWSGVGRNHTADEQEANARLIAAAPAVVEALEGLLNWLEDGTPTSERSDEENRCIAAARAALLSATPDEGISK